MQKLSHRFLHLFLVLCLIRVALSDGGGKYSKSANEERQFRVQKLNFVWSKAVRQLERPELKRLEMELDELDSAYLAAKDAHFSGKDRDKQQLVDLDKQLRLILRQLNVENILDALEKKAKWAHEHEHAGSENDVHHDDRFSDQRLTELWQSAKNAGFSKDELKALREEFYHHERKINEYNDLANDYNKIAHKNSLNGDVDDNDEVDAQSKADTKRMKQAFRDIGEGYNRFADKIANASASANTEFTNSRVKELWQEAKNNKGFSKEELDSIRHELKDFEARLEKLKFLESEVALSKESRRAAGKSPDSVDHHDVENRFSDLSRKVKKYEDYISSKITHNEL